MANSHQRRCTRKLGTAVLAAAWILYPITLAGDTLELKRTLSLLRSADQPFKNSRDYLQEVGETLTQWEQLPLEDRGTTAHLISGLYFERALWFTNNYRFEEAAGELSREAAFQSEYGGELQFLTKSPDQFFEKLVTIQATVADNTGVDPLAGLVTYSFEKKDNGFRASRVERFTDIMGIEVPELRDGERIATVHDIRKVGGDFDVVDTRWLVIPDGELPAVLTQASRSIQFAENGKLEVTQQPSKTVDRPSKTQSAQGGEPEAAIEPRNPGLAKKAETSQPETALQNEESKTPTWPLVLGAIAVLGVTVILVRTFMRGWAS